MGNTKDDPRELKAEPAKEVLAPELPYQPPAPKSYQPRIGLIGCGGITSSHLAAYQKMGYDVVALCDVRREAAEDRQSGFYPQADVYTDYRELLDRQDIDVVDLATDPHRRVAIIRDAIQAGKHALSQKPFTTDLAVGRELVGLAEDKGLKLAVNQNGRWAPYFSYLRQAVKQGLLGEIISVDVQVVWDHTWIKGTAFEKMHHVIIYDFAIHWFDIVTCVFGQRSPREVFAQAERVPAQDIDPPLCAQAVVQYDGGLASLAFRASTRFDAGESTVVTGTKGVFRSSGPVCANDQVTLTTAEGQAHVELQGNWFNDGFAGAMGELLCAIEEGREPENSARSNLRSLQLCFAAVASAENGTPITPGDSLTIKTLSPDEFQALAPPD